jgi:hypothetical protein
MNPTMLESAGVLEDQDSSKDRLIDALQAQLQEARGDFAAAEHRLVVTEARLEESRRALDRCMGFRS